MPIKIFNYKIIIWKTHFQQILHAHLYNKTHFQQILIANN